MLWLAIHSRIISHRQFSEDCFFSPNSVSPMYLYLNKSEDDVGSIFICSSSELMILHQDVCSTTSSDQPNRNVWWTPERKYHPSIHPGSVSMVSYLWATVTPHCRECSQAVCVGMTAFAVKDISYLIWGELKAFRTDACVSCSAQYLLKELPKLLVF